MTEVLHLIDTYRVGGPGKTIINSAKYIDRTRYRVHVGAFTNPRAGHDEFATAVRAAAIPFLDLRETRRVQPEHVLQIRRYIRDQHIRIVHLHGYRTDLMGYLATRGLRGVGLLTTHHGWIRNTAKQEQVARFARWLCRRFDAVEVVSRRLLDDLSPSLREDGRAVVVHNAIVTADYRREGTRAAVRQQLGIAADAMVLGTIGRFSAEKGCLDLLEAFRRVAQAVPRAHLVLIGEGPLALLRSARPPGLSVAHRGHLERDPRGHDVRGAGRRHGGGRHARDHRERPQRHPRAWASARPAGRGDREPPRQRRRASAGGRRRAPAHRRGLHLRSPHAP
jgi:glycosyltransferase involved in cell wall biosynthesis